MGRPGQKVKQKGLAFVLVLAFVLILAITATAFITLSVNEIRMARHQCDSTKAFYIAEGGFERARYDLEEDDNWMGDYINEVKKGSVGPDGFYPLEYDSATKTSLGGEFTVRLKEIAGEDDEIWVKSKGTYDNVTRTIQAKLKSSKRFGSPSGVTSAIEAEGKVKVKGGADVNGDIEKHADLSFEDIFGVDKCEMEQIAQTSPLASYYTTPFNNDLAGIIINGEVTPAITWIEPNATDPQITQDGWAGSGILIVEDDLKITGGAFDGVIWVIGTLTISGNCVINGGIFVECGAMVETTLTGSPTVTYDSGAVGDAFYTLTSLPSVIESWQEVD